MRSGGQIREIDISPEIRYPWRIIQFVHSSPDTKTLAFWEEAMIPCLRKVARVKEPPADLCVRMGAFCCLRSAIGWMLRS